MPAGGPATETATAAAPAPAGCQSGTVVITYTPAEPDTPAICLKAGAQLQLRLNGQGLDGWDQLRVTPESAATVTYTPTATDTLAATVTPTGTAPFCLTTSTQSLASQAVYSWQLCVTVRH